MLRMKLASVLSKIMPDPTIIYEWWCPKCPSSVWAHSHDVKKLAELASFHTKSEHPSKKKKPDRMRDAFKEIFKLVPYDPKNP